MARASPRPTLVDDDVLTEIEDLTRLAPLHNPPAARGIRHARELFPGLPQVAVFDTAWFVDLPPAAATYALDTEIAAREGIRRYGMHGTSHAYVAAEAAAFLGRDPADVDLVTLHLGNGASATAVRGGRPVDTSMGFTPLEGLVMGTRPGDLDPGVLLHLVRHAGMDADDIEDLLHHRCGLQGMTGLHDFRDLMDAIDSGDDRARTAYDVYCHRLRKYVGAYLAVLGGADALVFTAGIGENVPRLRADALSGLTALGVEVDPERNVDGSGGARRISTDASPVRRPARGGSPDQRGALPSPARWRTCSADAAQPGQAQSRTSGRSSPCSRVQARARRRVSSISWRTTAARDPRPGTRSITSITR